MCCSGCRLDPCGKRGAGRSDAIPSNGINHGHSNACSHNWDRFPGNDPDRKDALIRGDKARCTEWADVFRRGVPTAHVVIIPNADHYVYISNAEQVVTEINAFLARFH
jgi:pimeloyl-ACP methyl ester carboxylesterase